MELSEPTPRYQTQKAKLSIIEKFKWPHEQWMQDWPLEVSDKIDLKFCLQEYSKLVDDDEKFLLMVGILYALDEVQGDQFESSSQKTIELLKNDFDLHKFTIYYWTLYRDYPNEGDGFTITPLMRNIWNSQVA
jgi:hypothetical protein